MGSESTNCRIPSSNRQVLYLCTEQIIFNKTELHTAQQEKLNEVLISEAVYAEKCVISNHYNNFATENCQDILKIFLEISSITWNKTIPGMRNNEETLFLRFPFSFPSSNSS